MDANKRLKLLEIGYEVRPTCATCQQGRFEESSDFGVCNRFGYVHLKHSGAERELSINKSGVCPEHEWNDIVLLTLHAFTEFIK